MWKIRMDPFPITYPKDTRCHVKATNDNQAVPLVCLRSWLLRTSIGAFQPLKRWFFPLQAMARRLKASGTCWGFTKSCTVLDTAPICLSLVLLMLSLGNKLNSSMTSDNQIDLGADLTSACQMKALIGPQSALPPTAGQLCTSCFNPPLKKKSFETMLWVYLREKRAN